MTERFAYVCPSVWRDINVRTATGLMAAFQDKPPGESVYWEPLWNDALLARSRSLLATNFVDNPALAAADVLVMIDSDIVFSPEDFWKIVEGARATRSIYGGGYVVRSEQNTHLSSRVLPDTTVSFAAGPVRRPLEIEYLATGFWAVHRDVFDAMQNREFTDAYGGHTLERVQRGANGEFWPYFTTFITREADDQLHYLSEDWAFCERARQAGFSIWMDQSIILEHMGQRAYTVADMESGIVPVEGGTDVVVYPPDEIENPEPLVDGLVAEIAAFGDEDEGDVRRMLPGAPGELGRLWLTRSEAEDEWYRREDVGLRYILDLANWAQRGGGVPMDYVNNVAGKRLLDFGGGIGTWGLAASRAGAEVTVVETNPVLREFMAFRAERHGLSLTVVETLEEAGSGFDAVSCWHVFEHLEDAERVLCDLLLRMKVGGVFISDSGFDDPGTPMHHVRSDWEDVLAAAGLSDLGSGRYRFEPAAVPV